jgi:integrase
MGSIRERKGAHGTTYNALWRDPNGKQCSRSFPTRAAAKAFLKPHSAVPGYPAPVPEHAGSVAAYAAVWIEEHDLKPVARQTYRNVLEKHILPALGRHKLAHVTRADIYIAVKRWQKAGMGPTVQAKCRTVMSAMFEDAVARGVIPANPVRGVKIARQTVREMRILTVEEYKRVLRYLDPQPRLMVRLAVASGARWGELSELRGTDLASDMLTISRNVAELKNPRRFEVQDTPKNGKSRKVKLPPALSAEVYGHSTDPSALLFPAPGGGHLSREQFHAIWQRAQKAAAISPPCRVHDLRHTAISWWLADGMPLATVREQAGHSSIAVTSRYVHAIDDAEDEALGRSVA